MPDLRFSAQRKAAGCDKPTPPVTHATLSTGIFGRWHPNKGIDLLLEALSQLKHENCNVSNRCVFSAEVP